MSEATTLLRNPVDAHVGSANPSSNHADAKKLWLESSTDTSYAFVFFNRPFPLGATIINATLRVYTDGAWNIAPTLTVRRVLDRWNVNKLTWNNRPNVTTTTVQTSKSSAADDDEWAFDVTQFMQTVANGGVWYGFRIGTDATARKALHSGSTAVGTRPQLEVTWSRAPQPPTTLTPSGSRAVSVAKPVVSFDFTDHLGSTQLQAVQVQIDPNGNWTTPAFDSGVVAATEPELDLATTTYAGVTAGQETRWRAKVQDGAGLWSEWSDVARFRRDNKGALTITNPAVAPNDFVSEWTPPIIWSLTGETQKAWQVFVTPADDHTDHLHDTGRTKGTDTSWTLPKGVIEDDERYRVVVRVWDSKDRQATPGDPPFTQVEREFEFREDGTPNPVTSLTALNLLPRPWMRLEWQRSTAPDSFTIKRNGKVIETGLDPAALLLSGTTYRWTDKDASPNRNHTYVVQAFVNGKSSANNPSVTALSEVRGIWLVDRERDIDVLIKGREPGEWSMGEDATTHYPMGDSKPVRITQSLRGWEGHITGTLTTSEGLTAQEWQDRLLRIKSRPGDNLTLTLGQESMRVEAYNIVVAPTGNTPTNVAVDFDFHQVGRLDYRPRL
jgi:hypothetical protein